MSSLEKRHTGQRGSMQGHHKYSDGFSDTSSSGSFMDDTDREVSNLTDRAFRSLCIGEEAIYNDSEFSSSPTERHKAFAEETQQKTVSLETFSYSIQQYGETEAESEMASTFQHSYVDVTHQEQAFREGSLSYINNGSKEVTWQQGRSSSRVSSLIKAFSSGECYRDGGTCDIILARDKNKDFKSEACDKSSLLSIQRELSESGPFQSYRNHFYTSDVAAAVAQMDTTVLMKTSKSNFKALNSTNVFFHSEFSPFQLWEEYNRFPFESTNVSGFMSASEFPRWYDSPMYKELKDNHRIPNSQCESTRFSQRQIKDIVASQHSRSMVIQKASAIEKRCESEMASNYPPWKKSNNFVRNKLPGNRPSTVSPTNERTCRPDSSLFSYNKVTQEIVVESTLPSSVTPFNITQLLTPVIHTRQETETSEILQFAHTPSVSDYSSQGETDPKLQTDVKHLRDSYKSKASGLLFNLKDNRKRVKSTYSPTRFKGLEITDRNKQTSKLEGRESRFSDILISQDMAQENLTAMDSWAPRNLIREPSAAPITVKDYTDGFRSYDNLTLTSPQIQDGVANCKSFHGSSEGHSPSTDPLATIALSTHNLSAQDKSSLTSGGQINDPNSSFSPARPEIANVHPKVHPPTHSLPTQTSEQYGQSDNVNLKQRQDFGRATFIENSQNEAVKERCPWDQIGLVKETDGRSFRGEIAALIEMDKQRKATAKQYSANDSYYVQKENYLQKVNEDIKLGRLSKGEAKEDKEDRKMSYSDKSVHNNQFNTFSNHTESYRISQNSLQNKTSPLKEVYDGLQSFNVKNDHVKEVPEQNAFSNSTATQKTYDQTTTASLQDHKSQKNEGLYSYQPYRYEPNKQWHVATTSDNRHTKESVSTQKQSETLEQTGAKNYKISNTSSSRLHITQNEFSTNNSAPNPGLQDEDSVLPVDTSDQNNTTKHVDRFSINDILAIRDNEQARRLKDNTFNLAKSENVQNQIKYETADKPNKMEPVMEQDQGYKVQDTLSPLPGNFRKDFHNTNETNINNDRRNRVMNKDTDKVTTRALSYKERGQSKQEILTSKLKAHAQKEISAIKEKELAKQGILARNATKASVTISNDDQEGHSVKKEITADKLNHLFQDITYSSITQYKESSKTHSDAPKNGSTPSTETQPSHFQDNQKDNNVKCTPLSTERQHDNHQANDKEMMKELFPHEGGAILPDMKNKAQKIYQPCRVSEGNEISVTDSENIESKKESAKQSHEMSPTELMSDHLTSVVKTGNYTSLNPPALHIEAQTIQHDQRESLHGAMTKPADATKKGLQVTSTESTKCNTGLKKNSFLGLERNTPRVEEDNVHLKSKTAAAMEKSKNEPIKNSSGITACQLTSSSSDMKFKNGIPPAIRLMEPAISDLTSNLQTNTLSANAEQLINRTYKHNSGVSTDLEASSTEIIVRVKSASNTASQSNTTSNMASERTREPKRNKLKNENGQALIIKNNTSRENVPAKKQHNTLQVKAVELTTASQIAESQSTKPGTNKESLTQIASSKAEEACQQKELHEDDENTKTLLSFDKNVPPRSQRISKIKEDSDAANNSQEGKKRIESASPEQKEQGFPRPSNEKNNPKSTKVFQAVNPNNSEPKNPAQDELEPNISSQHKITVNEHATQKNNTPPVSTQNVESTADMSNITNLVPSKEESAEEPMIYSIYVSSKTEAASEDEPMIFNICVSSKCHNDEQQNPVKLEDETSVKTESSICVSSKCHDDEQQNPVKPEEDSSVKTERCVKDENFGTKNDENEHHDVHRQNAVSSSNKAKEDKIAKCELPATTDKSNAIGRITTSYEDLLVKYGLPARDHSHIMSKHVEEERERKEKEETETHLSHKPLTHGINRPLASTQKIPDDSQTCPDDSRQVSAQQPSNASQPLKDTESKIEQVKVPLHDIHSTVGNNTSRLGHTISDVPLIPKDMENVEQQDQNTHNIELLRQSRRNDVQSKKKQVEEQVRITEKVDSVRMTENYFDDVSNSPRKAENVSLTAKQSAMSESIRATETAFLKTPSASGAKDTSNTKSTESTVPRRTTPQAENKPEEVKGEDKMFNQTDTIMPQKNKMDGREEFNPRVQKTIHEVKQKDSIIAMKQDSVPAKDAQNLKKNRKGDLEEKAQEKLQFELNRNQEFTNRMKMVSKNGSATHVNIYNDKVSSNGEDVCTVVKQDQASSEAPKIHLEDIKVSTEEVSSNKEFMAVHKNQHEVIKRENLKGKKGTAVTEHVGEQALPEQKNLLVRTLITQNEPKTMDNIIGPNETTPKHTYDFEKEITPQKKDGPCESEKTGIIPREGAVRSEEIKVYDNKQSVLNGNKGKTECPELGLSRQNDGDFKVDEKTIGLREKKDRHVEARETEEADLTISNQYQSERSFGPERSYEQEHAQISQQDKRKEGKLSKSEEQRNKKVTRPEISAIADYARLKVISAEDDTKELDIFPKLDFYNSHDQSALRIHKDSHGNVSETVRESKKEAISMEKGQNLKETTLQLRKQKDKEMLPQKHNPTMSTVEPKPASQDSLGSQEGAASGSTQPRTLTNHEESSTKQTLTEHPNRGESNKNYQSKNPRGTNTVQLQAEGPVSRSRQMTEKANLSHYGRRETIANLPSSGTVKPADNHISIASPAGEEMEILQYYTVNALDTGRKPNETPEPPAPSPKISQNKDSAEKSEAKKEDSLFLQSLMDHGKVPATGPRSNSSSPAMGKPTMFRVKDNTTRMSSVTKTVKPRFHRSFSDDLRIGSPKDHLSSSDKEDEIYPKESPNPPVLHESAVAAHRLHKVKETLHNNLSSAEYTINPAKSHQRRSQHFEEEETRSVISTMSEDMENCTARLTDLVNASVAFMPRNESYRDTYQRPASACYERAESACYERPESACSDIRSLGKPPTVPPKSEKALRRAQRLTTRRLKKTETPKIAPENQEQLESKSIRSVSSEPSSSSDIVSTPLAVQASHPLSQYDIQPNYTPPAHSIVAQTFPMTQRKLLQDPSSGQYFMVDVPLPVKTKTFYDPETGKYVQLNVRQRSQGAITQPAAVEMLNAPYMLYRGFLPMAASSLPHLRTSSEMSASAALTNNQDTHEAGSELWKQNIHLQNHSSDSQQYPEILYRPHEEIHSPSSNAENSVNNNERHTDIITMSELEDFVMEST